MKRDPSLSETEKAFSFCQVERLLFAVMKRDPSLSETEKAFSFCQMERPLTLCLAEIIVQFQSGRETPQLDRPHSSSQVERPLFSSQVEIPNSSR